MAIEVVFGGVVGAMVSIAAVLLADLRMLRRYDQRLDRIEVNLQRELDRALARAKTAEDALRMIRISLEDADE